jgi:hypothetical protein
LQCSLYYKKLFGVRSRTLSECIEELIDVGNLLRETVWREGFEEESAVALALDAEVEEHEDAAVGERTDEVAGRRIRLLR